MTDVTGFSLVGHAIEMAERSGVTVVLDSASVPLLEDALRFAREGAVTGGGGRNVQQLGERIRRSAALDEALVDVLYDPQTSGGLLIAVSQPQAEPLRRAIEEREGGCWVVGSIEAGAPIVEVR